VCRLVHFTLRPACSAQLLAGRRLVQQTHDVDDLQAAAVNDAQFDAGVREAVDPAPRGILACLASIARRSVRGEGDAKVAAHFNTPVSLSPAAHRDPARTPAPPRACRKNLTMAQGLRKGYEYPAYTPLRGTAHYLYILLRICPSLVFTSCFFSRPYRLRNCFSP